MSTSSDIAGLPSGWAREETTRKTGISAGKVDVYYHGPDGLIVRSKPELARALEGKVDLSCFDYKSGKILQGSLRKSKSRMRTITDGRAGYRHDSNLVLPIRQTASIFKQPVTVIRTQPKSQTRNDIKHGSQEPPRQLFWERRLRSLFARNIKGSKFEPLSLPSKFQPSLEDLTYENMLQSIAAILHLNQKPVTGQCTPKNALRQNPAVLTNPDQPVIQAVVVTEDDIRQQQHKVSETRKELEKVIKLCEKLNHQPLPKDDFEDEPMDS
ncbi:DgyrCDS11890 [Dimorphilus gyrociliatus]|uniref:DgyrCDS11890 n=1 Tax=Dimorphilus gyrociliatus TaxID=2664684 RepID=A0A7I8W633_9ANNE|nr:DgyrCDS11890 [Dimorphilus gyrociliatus]